MNVFKQSLSSKNTQNIICFLINDIGIQVMVNPWPNFGFKQLH
jgi:hypothetical protein